MPADPGWPEALETASCSGWAPGWCNLGGPVTFLLASGPCRRGNKAERGTPEHLGGPFPMAQGVVGLTSAMRAQCGVGLPSWVFHLRVWRGLRWDPSTPRPLPLPSVLPAQLPDQGGPTFSILAPLGFPLLIHSGV